MGVDVDDCRFGGLCLGHNGGCGLLVLLACCVCLEVRGIEEDEGLIWEWYFRSWANRGGSHSKLRAKPATTPHLHFPCNGPYHDVTEYQLIKCMRKHMVIRTYWALPWSEGRRQRREEKGPGGWFEERNKPFCVQYDDVLVSWLLGQPNSKLYILTSV